MSTVGTGARNDSGSSYVVVGGILGVVLSALLAVTYPLVAPAVAAMSITHSVVQYRKTRRGIWMTLTVIATMALAVALTIDLGLLVAEQHVGPASGPVPTK